MHLEVPWAFIPTALVIDGWVGDSASKINGEYILQPTSVYGHPTWGKQSPGGNKAAYILRDFCGAWLISAFRDGKRKACHGWAAADARDCGAEPGGRPWECTGNWTVARKNWLKDPSVVVTPALTTAWQECSPDDEARVIHKFGNIDIVIPWVNGSDSTWLQARRQACEAYHWERLWPEVVIKSPDVKRCLQKEQARDEAVTEPLASEAAGDNSSMDRGITSKTSRCFQDFIPCDERPIGIADHDELRYLLRSLQQHLRWHTGRIVLIVPDGQRPAWLVSTDRLHVLSQENLIKAAMASPHFQREPHQSYFAPSRIFNDFPVELSLPFLPGATETIMLLQDDILLARPVKPCEIFTQHGLQLFATTYEPDEFEDPYENGFSHMLTHTARLWGNFVESSRSVVPVPFYRIYHAPVLLSVATLEALWRQWPRELSATLDSAFRHPWLLDIVGLHHTWLAQRSREARIWYFSKKNDEEQHVNDTRVLDTVSASRVVDLQEFDPKKDPLAKLRFVEVNCTNIWEWDAEMAKLKPNPAELPMSINFQDSLDAPDGQDPELDCLRERWLMQLLPDPSSFEDPTLPPDKCEGVRELRKPWGFIPTVLTVNSKRRKDSLSMNGEYTLLPDFRHGHPTWVKKSSRGSEVAFVLKDYCGAWLISPHKDGNGKKCNGWAFAKKRDCGAEPAGRPWECIGNWQAPYNKGWSKDPSIIVTLGGHDPHEDL